MTFYAREINLENIIKMEINYCVIFLKLFCLYLLTFPSFVDCFKITNCGSNKLFPSREISNKSVVQFNSNTSPIPINQKNRVELWCESDCWYSECTLTHVPNKQFGCDIETEGHEEIHTEEVDGDFGDSKRHVCKFVLDKIFDCPGNVRT
jgi:hypothetical protein